MNRYKDKNYAPAEKPGNMTQSVLQIARWCANFQHEFCRKCYSMEF